MDDTEQLANRFEAQRSHLRAVAYRMLGSAAEADDAVQEAWLRLARSDVGEVENLAGWLTTVVSRICLDMLRTRSSRGEQPLAVGDAGPGGARLPAATPAQALASSDQWADPAHEAELVDSVGRALLVVLDRLPPRERVAFVLHDMFAVPFEQVAAIVERSPVAAKKLASRARGRVAGTAATATVTSAADRARQREVVGAYLAAARRGDIDGLLAVLAPEVVRTADPVAVPADVPSELRGADAVAAETAGNAARARVAALALVDGSVGLVVAPAGRLRLVLRLTVADGTITAVDVVAEPARLATVDLSVIDL